MKAALCAPIMLETRTQPTTTTRTARGAPEVSFVMPCFDEQAVVPYSIPQLVEAFRMAGVSMELVAVDNGSSDRTAEIIQGFVDEGLPVALHRIERNEGYGNGLLEGAARCSAPWVGFIPADGQVDAEDVVRLYQAVVHADELVLGKVRRRFRMDGPVRKLVSVAYNLFVWGLWPGLGSIDVNGSPKIVHRALFECLGIESRGWFFDPELMIKAHYLGVRVLEMNVFARMRSNGLSHVRAGTCLEFLVHLLRYRFGGELKRWRAELASRAPLATAASSRSR